MNLPNKLSCIRIAMVPLITICYIFVDFQIHWNIQLQNQTIVLSSTRLLVLILFAIASITDFFDGYLARKRNMITSFGKFIDPIADKLLVNTMFILFATDQSIPLIPVLIMIWRDMIVDGLRMSASAKGKVVAAGMPGKIKTVLQMAAILIIGLSNLPFAYLQIPMDQILLWGAAFVSIWSGVDYFMKLKDVVMETM